MSTCSERTSVKNKGDLKEKGEREREREREERERREGFCVLMRGGAGEEQWR